MPWTRPGVLPVVALVAVAPAHLKASGELPNAARTPRAAVAADAPEPAAPAPSDRTEPFEGAERLDRAALVRSVLARNPEIEAARLAARAAAERVPQATSLDDPMLSYGVGPLSLVADDTRFGQVLRVGQHLPYPGTLRLRGEAAGAEADAAHREIETVRLELATAASLLYDDYYLVHRALAINDEHIRLLEGFQRIATARYAAGEAPQQAPLQAEVELAHLVHRGRVLETRREVVAARINALLHRDPAAELPPPPHRLARPDAAELELPALLDRALAMRPELERIASQIEARRARLELRELERYPEFEATASYNSMWGNADHRLMVGVGVNVPRWRDRIEAGVAEAEAELARAESERARLEDEIGAEVRIALERLRESRHVAELYRDRLLPASRDQVRAAQANFETGQVSFLSLIDAERNQRSVELEYEETLAELYRRRAELDRALGRVPGRWAAENEPAGAPSGPAHEGVER